MPRSLIGLALAVLAAGGGCGTKVLELGGLDSGAPPFPGPFCLSYSEADGSLCMRCYDQWGTMLKGGCPPAPPPPGVPGPECVSKADTIFERCIFCGPKMEQRACLKCDSLPLDQPCRHCTWTDSGQMCKQCFDPAGKPQGDDCNVARGDLTKVGP
jgi:hypothetical protein